MNEKMRAAERDLCARAKLTFSTGASVWAEGESVVSFTVREGADSPLLPGNVLCAEYELELANDDGQWRSGGALRGNRPLLGATAELFVRCGGEDAACGVFVVDEVRMDERGGTVRLCGGDSIGSEMAAEFRDELSYPAALSQIWAALVAQTRYEWDGELPNGAAIVDARPEWNGASLRRAAGWIAQAAGCFVRVGRAGALEAVPCRAGAEAALTADDYLTMVDGMDVYGPVTGLRVTPMGAEEAAEISDGDGEIVTVTENPLFQSGAAHLTALMRGMLDELSGLVLRRMEVNWRGDPALGVGARIALTDTFGGEHAGVITRQTLRFERGFSAECACETPDVGDAGVLRAITPEGGLNAAALVGAVDGGRLVVGSVTARAIAAGSVTAGKLAAGSVETDALAAGAVTAGKIAAGAVETEKLAAGSVTAGKLAAEAVTADKLAAGAVKAEKIKAGAVDTAKLAAGAVTAEKIASGTITADRLKAKTITAESGIIDDSAIGTAQIADGSITSAKIVELNADLIQTGTLSAERLLLVGEDGVIYKINVASSGLSLTELQEDQYKNYINGTVIVAKSITAAQIAAQTITGNEILAGSVTAKEIDVSDLFASEATINALNAMDIRGNEYLQLYVTDKVDGIAVGGRNLLRNTNQGTVNWDWSMQTGGKTIEEYLDGGVRAVRMTRDAVEQTGWSIISYAVSEDAYAHLEPNTEYTLSFDYKPSVATANGVMFSIRRDDGSNAATNEGGYWKEIPANEWTHVSGTFTTVENIPNFSLYSTEIYIMRLPTTVNSVHIFKNLKLEKGNKATDWSPAPEDPAGSLSVNSDYSKVDINTERVRIVSKRMEVAVPSDDGEDDVLRVDADGVHAEVVEADVIVSESVVRTQGAASYTPANAGELAAILEELSGKHLTGSVSINCKNVSSGSFSIDRISGGGYVSLNNGTMNALEITNCGASVVVYLSRIAFSTSGTALTISNAHEVYVDSCTFNAGVGVHLGSGWPSQAYMASCAGDCATMAQVALMSRLCICGASKPTGTVSLNYGGEVYNATSDPTFAAKASPSIPTTQTVTVSLSPTQTYTLRGTSNSDGNKLYQGRYSSSQPLRRGVMLFTLPTDLTSADKIDSATLTIRRIGGVGQGGGVSVHVRCYDVSGTLYASKTAYDGQTVSIDVTAAVKAMKTNGYAGLMLYNPDTTTAGSKSYTASYARFAGKGESGAPMLKVSYRK